MSGNKREPQNYISQRVKLCKSRLKISKNNSRVQTTEYFFFFRNTFFYIIISIPLRKIIAFKINFFFFKELCKKRCKWQPCVSRLLVETKNFRIGEVERYRPWISITWDNHAAFYSREIALLFPRMGRSRCVFRVVYSPPDSTPMQLLRQPRSRFNVSSRCSWPWHGN